MLSSSSNCYVPIFLKMILLNVIIVQFMLSCGQNPSLYWPENGTSFRNITYELALADSLSILKIRQNNWILPDIEDSVATKVELVHHRSPEGQPYRKLLGTVDQEVVHDEGLVSREFYCFDRKGVLLLGIESRDSTRLLTVYDPPLLLLPNVMERLDSTIVHESVPRVWNAVTNTSKEKLKTRIRLTLEKQGRVWLDSSSVPAILYRMALSQDGMVEFGATNLIVPDAVLVEGKILFVQGIGPVLEWGIRSSLPEANAIADPHAIPELDRRSKVPKFYIEMILHKKIPAQ